jgi:hypothetical protein
MKSKLFLALLMLLGAAPLQAIVYSNSTYSISTNPTNNLVVVNFSNRFFTGACAVESREGNRWVVLKDFFTTQRVQQVTVPLPTNNYGLLRLRCLDLTADRPFTRPHLAKAYGDIHTIAGGGPNRWPNNFEGALATTVELNNPRFAVADEANNIYVVERDGHAVDKITPDGRIHTFVGTHVSTNIGDVPGPGLSSPLSYPNGLWLQNNRLFILDAGNSRVRFVDLNDTNRTTYTLFADASLRGIGTNGSGLWVGFNKLGEPDEAFYGVGNELRQWTIDEGVSVLASDFQEVGNVIVNPLGRTIVTDPKDHRVFRVRGTGVREVVAGTGFPHGPHRGGDAEDVPLPGVRGIWYLPIGGYFLGLDEGARVWYVDGKDNAAPFIFGKPGVHDGDEMWFRQGGTRPKVSNIISVTVAPSGDIILVEGNGLIRKIDFLFHRP